MPFRSKIQMRAAFSGALGPEMKARANKWAKETPSIKSLPDKKIGAKDKRRKASYENGNITLK